MGKIKFGTSGWRAIIAEDFTFHNVKKVCQAIALYVKEKGEGDKGIIIGYDRRFLSENFARSASEVIAGNNIEVLISDRDVPTPVISFEIIRRKCAGGINFTASHNPPEYNGLKFSTSDGAPALPEVTGRIEKIIETIDNSTRILSVNYKQGILEKKIKEEDFRSAYMARLKEIVDINSISRKPLRVIVDHLYGTSKGYLDEILKDAGCEVIEINDYRDPYFGGKPPEPAEENIHDLIQKVKETDADLGVATDGDGDRFGVVDRDGWFVSPNYLIALCFNHLLKTRKLAGAVARTVATTHFVDAIAAKNNIEVIETPVGFKYIGDLIAQDKIIIGGEESAGLTIKGHIPEKDGILACLLAVEMVSKNKKTLKEQLFDLFNDVGHFYNIRINIPISNDVKERLLQDKSLSPDYFAGTKILDINREDGIMFKMEDSSWVLMRFSGTEPVIRLYCESSTEEKLDNLIKASKIFIGI